MTLSQSDEANQRVIILAPTGKDAALAAKVLTAGSIETLICADVAELPAILNVGAGCLLVAEEAISHGKLNTFVSALAGQAPWSDLPVLLLTRYGADSTIVAQALQRLDNVTLVERPVRPATLLSLIRSALKARARQFQVCAILQKQELVEEALREGDRRKDEFLATLAHELRNPLAPIRNSLHILRLSGRKDPALEKVCEMMERQFGHLMRLVDDLMEVSRITRGKVELKMEPIEIAAAIRSAVEASLPLIEASQHQLAISLPAKPLIVQGDAVRLSQIFSNLLNNAAKYMHEGGQIWLNVRETEDHVVVSIRDTGVGIASEMLPRVFDMFTQVDRSKRQAQGGLGIGLTLVNSLVKLHGGKVEALSPGVEQGSEFIVHLPLSKCVTSEYSRRSDSIPGALTSRKVLIVDDNVDAARSLGTLLDLMGAETLTVNDGPSALSVIGEYQPNVVLLDIGMPGMDGYEVARQIRARDDLQEFLLIALTGWGQEEDRRRTVIAGFDYHLLKPADLTVLKSLLVSSRTPDCEE